MSKRKKWMLAVVLAIILVIALGLYSLPLSRLKLVMANVYGGMSANVTVLVDGKVVLNETMPFYSTNSHSYWVVQGQHSITVTYCTESDTQPHRVYAGSVDGNLRSLESIDFRVLDTVTVEVNVG